MKKYKIITLCGSIKFKDDFLREEQRLALDGNIVLSVTFFDKDIHIDEQTKIMLDQIHKSKIDLADEIFVINKNGYIGQSTQSEIEYALKNGKKINFLEN